MQQETAVAVTERLPTIVPMLSYEDIGAAADWLTNAFGFREQLRYTEGDGRVTHVQLELGGGVVMLGTPSPHYQDPRRHAAGCEQARKWLESPYVVDGVHVYVDDIEAHYRRAKEAGATMLSEVVDAPHGDRLYRVEDFAGHRWMFAQHVRDVPAEEWGATRG